MAALSTRTATRPAWTRVVSVRFFARFVTWSLSGRPRRRSSVSGIKPAGGRWYGGTTVVPQGRRGAPSSCRQHVNRGFTPAYRQGTPRKGAEFGIRRPDRDPAGQQEQVRGRPRERADPAGPAAVHLDPVPGRLRLCVGHPGR